MQLVIDLPSREEQLAFNRRRWEEICRDPFLASIEGRFETDHNGRILFMPPAHANHSARVSRIFEILLRQATGRVLAECPVSTLAGVRVADLGWFSDQRYARVAGPAVFEEAPELCVEVVSPANSPSELKEKRELYFEAGAVECWECSTDGEISFFGGVDRCLEGSDLFPGFPDRISA